MEESKLALGTGVRDGKVVVSVHNDKGTLHGRILEVALEPEDAAQFVSNLLKAIARV